MYKSNGTVRGYPAITNDSKVYVRLTKQNGDALSNHILQINPSAVVDMLYKIYKYPKDGRIIPGTRKILDYNIMKVSGVVKANPKIDGNGLVYIGTLNGNVHVFTPSGEEKQIIEIGNPISHLVIGPEKSLIVMSDDKVSLVQ